ncbi:hypothetical protein R1flu_017169 [Riccia fluitans]|uniref:Uncharacterized protein n=1 Tax=Riccia fluitans TaxID=41844 RepID=A0ABD1XHE0_9MARC
MTLSSPEELASGAAVLSPMKVVVSSGNAGASPPCTKRKLVESRPRTGPRGNVATVRNVSSDPYVTGKCLKLELKLTNATPSRATMARMSAQETILGQLFSKEAIDVKNKLLSR